jgi:hypothetical protein
MAQPRWLSHGLVLHGMSESTSRGRAENLQAPTGSAAPYAPMKVLDLLHVMVAQAFYKWAMREINPMHPDVPKIMVRQQQLAEKYRRVWG